MKRSTKTILKGYAYAWITLTFFLSSLALHWWFGWGAFADEARAHSQSPEFGVYATEMLRDTFENWQSEFLQLLWQVVGLAYFLYLGSPSSHENDDRLEAKVDALLHLQGDRGKEIIVRLDRHFMRHPRERRPSVGDDELDRLLRG
ncbi:MAG TPA: DUF6766 family protein, partial [Sphingomicrobium sp.]|nr:DUF6766 family protein [Sphingomicrobium sp.]